MTFQSYAEGRGFKNYHVQIPIGEFQNQILVDGKRKATFIRNKAEEVKQSRNEEFQIIARSHQAMERNRAENHRFREANLNAIHEAEIENFKMDIADRNAARGRGSKEQTALEKLAPLLDVGSQVWKQHVAIRQAQQKARYQQAHNMIVATGLTTKQMNEAFAMEEAIRNETTEGIQALYKINKKNGLTGVNVFTAENLALLRKHSGEYDLNLKHQLAINSFQQLDSYIRANQHLVDEETGLSFYRAFHPKYNTDWSVREQLWAKTYSAFTEEEGIRLHELPASIAGGSFSKNVQGLKDKWFAEAGRKDDLFAQTEESRTDARAFERALFDDDPDSMVRLHNLLAQRSFTPKGKPNYDYANETIYGFFKQGVKDQIVGWADIDAWMHANESNMGRMWKKRYQMLKHDAEVARASIVQDQENIKKIKQIQMLNALEHEFNTNSEQAQAFAALSLDEQRAMLKDHNMDQDTINKFLTKLYGDKVGTSTGAEIDQDNTFSSLKEWIPQQIAFVNDVAEKDLGKVQGYDFAKQELTQIATTAYNRQWRQTHDPIASRDYAVSVVQETLDKGRFNINKDNVMIDGVEQVRSIDEVGERAFFFNSFHSPGTQTPLDTTRAKVTRTFTNKTKAEGLDMVRAISNEEQAAEIMPRSVIEEATVNGKFSLSLFGRNAAVQRAVEETGASVSYLADQLLRGYGLEGLDPVDVADPEEVSKLSDAAKAAYRDRSTRQSSVDVNRAVINQNRIVGFTGESGRSRGAHAHIESGNGESDHPDRGLPVPADVLSRILVAGKPMNSYTQTSGLGDGRGHQGFDFATPAGLPITLTGGLRLIDYDDVRDPSGYGNSIWIKDTVNGRDYLIAHLSAGPN